MGTDRVWSGQEGSRGQGAPAGHGLGGGPGAGGHAAPVASGARAAVGTGHSAPAAALGGWEYDEALRCVKCGFCLQSCPTYRQTGIETASPRGRLALVRAVAEGVLPLDEGFADAMYLCLGCRACEAVCPSGLQYGRVLEGARAALEPVLAGSRSPGERLVRWLAFRHLLPHRGRLRLAAALARVARPVAARLLPGLAGHLAAALPPAPPAAQRRRWAALERQGVVPAVGRRRARVALLPGCVLDALFLPVNLAAVAVLTRLGCEVVIARDAPCCGALHAHQGRLDEARALAARHLAAVPADVDAVITAAGGCGAHLKGYGHLLPGAAALAARVRDLSEWLVELGAPAAPWGRLEMTVAYQDSCHLAHGQGVRQAPRDLLRAIPGLRLVELPWAGGCCGSAGIYNLTQPAMAAALLDELMAAVAASGAQVVATANPGCHLQILAGVRRHRLAGKVAVRHVAEILAQSLESGR